MAPFFVDPTLLVEQLDRDRRRSDGAALARSNIGGQQVGPNPLVPVLEEPAERWHAMIDAPLRCVPGSCFCGCGTVFSTMPALKAHLAAAFEKA